MKSPSIIWFRQDLRLEDHPALAAALARGSSVIPVYIWSPDDEGEWALGGASRWWLHGALERLQRQIKKMGGELVIRKGKVVDTLKTLCEECGADTVFWSRRYEPYAMKCEAHLKSELGHLGIQGEAFRGSLLYEPWEVLNKQNKPYQVFTHFWNSCLEKGEPQSALDAPLSIPFYNKHLVSMGIRDLSLLPNINWDAGFYDWWRPETLLPLECLNDVIDNKVINYSTKRDFLADNGTSLLSSMLHFGEISPRMIWRGVRKRYGDREEVEVFLRQLGWREFGHYLLYHFPYLPTDPIRTQYAQLPWDKNPHRLKAWKEGMTGYPIVDAGMRQLWKTGWMHNRARMIVGSFLVKDLLIDWREGARWFWETLVDADLANNSMGWQWVAGCGVDAAPYFRVFNPVSQGEKFDPSGDYVRRWVPELASLPDKWIHAPWEAPPLLLRSAGVVLGKDYPYPIVNHAEAREKFLEMMKA